MITSDCTAATASGDTVETTLGTVTLPSNAKRIIGVGVSCGGAGATTLEGVSGMFRISINNIDVTPAKFCFSYGLPITSGIVPTEAKIFPVDWSPAGNSVVTFYVTMDMAQTVNNTFRGFVIYEK